MRGDIYQLAFAGDDGSSHPHLIVVEMVGTRECLVIPGYGAEGHAIRSVIAAYKRMGYRSDEIFCELDNMTCVDFKGTTQGKRCFWCLARAHRLTAKVVESGKLMGRMKPLALKEISQRFIALAKVRTELLSPKALKAFEQELARGK